MHATMPFVLCTTLLLLANCRNIGELAGKMASTLNSLEDESILFAILFCW